MSLPKNSIESKTNLRTESSKPSFTCALLTSVGRSAVAVIGVRGPHLSDMILQAFVPASKQAIQPGQIRYGNWGKTAEGDGESIVIVPISNQEWEIHSHGGTAAPTRIINDLRGLGAEEVDQRRWSADAGTPLLIQEAETVLASCLTTRMAAYAMDQVRGALSDWCKTSLVQLVDGTTESIASGIKTEAGLIANRSDAGLRLAKRFQVVLLGPPNVGKSSLINAMVGYDRSITMDMEGTTRDVLHADTVINGVPIRLSDTAGIRKSRENIEQMGVAKARLVASEADLLIAVRDPSSDSIDPPNGITVLKVMNKADLVSEHAAEELLTVATTGQGVPELMETIVESLLEFPPANSPMPVNDRQLSQLKRISTAKSPAELRIALESLYQGS